MSTLDTSAAGFAARLAAWRAYGVTTSTRHHLLDTTKMVSRAQLDTAQAIADGVLLTAPEDEEPLPPVALKALAKIVTAFEHSNLDLDKIRKVTELPEVSHGESLEGDGVTTESVQPRAGTPEPSRPAAGTPSPKPLGRRRTTVGGAEPQGGKPCWWCSPHLNAPAVDGWHIVPTGHKVRCSAPATREAFEHAVEQRGAAAAGARGLDAQPAARTKGRVE